MALTLETSARAPAVQRRTTSDDIFDEIYLQISTLKIPPGTKLSEVEIAKQFDVSRQPVREAFIRLSNIGLLVIRPQRATVVRKISLQEVATARFIRLSIELEVSRRACANFEPKHEKAFTENLAAQKAMIDSGSLDGFGKLDARFHKLICDVAGMPGVYDTIAEQKAKVDRLCALSLNNVQECKAVYKDHEELFALLIKKDTEGYLASLRSHLSRLDVTIAQLSQSHQHFIE